MKYLKPEHNLIFINSKDIITLSPVFEENHDNENGKSEYTVSPDQIFGI